MNDVGSIIVIVCSAGSIIFMALIAREIWRMDKARDASRCPATHNGKRCLFSRGHIGSHYASGYWGDQ